MGTYATPTSPTLTRGFLVRSESRVLLGINGETDLETTSWPASVYSAPIGMASGQGLDLGYLADLSWSQVPAIEPVEGVNVQNDRFYEITGEESTLTVAIREFKPQVLAEAIASGKLYVLGDEALITFGGDSSVDELPLVVEFTNLQGGAPSSANIGSGITGGILTLYKTVITGGLEMAFSAREVAQVPLEFRVIPDTDKAAGNRLGNLYLY